MAERSYLRDGRAPVPKDPRTSALMSRIKAKDTAPELALRKALRELGYTGYRLHYTKAPARPDIAFVGLRVAVLVHGCFWHGCPHCTPRRPRNNSAFWSAKLDANKARDARKVRELRQEGWRVVTSWECRIERNAKAQAERVIRALTRTR
ncbi:MAG: very short patch repair endonuclease [Flavobacteriales bacterium]|jgi:DNA mismatch endonuclease (patch repair protein)|nr:very short patch repair endonuclease [Flavobacteriales bacterium]MBP7448899.1 very short patch repair endonuclease [Flavobacteriales bacterium]HOZ40948.1 very short patch repair endonuclease [Flavobacteriales bacterium]